MPIHGWAWDSALPNTPINVEIYSDGVLVATVPAGGFRQDLLNAGIGNGNHAFQIAPPAAILNGQPHSITVKFAGTQTNLPGTPRSLNCIALGEPTPVYEGFHEGADCSLISGWAWDSQRPNTPINVDVYADGAFLLTTPADQFRQDLLNAGKGNGAHGFGFATPNSVKNGTPRSIAVRFAGTQVNLSATPKTINCAPAVSLSGTITYEGGPLSGAAVAGGNGASCSSTNASGQYTCTVAPGWSGTVTPSMAERVFTPASRSYTNVTAAQSAQDYTANATFYQVSGTITLNGLALPNVAVAATGGPTCTTTNGAGQYSCTVPFGWSGSVTPSASGFSFGPASRSYTSVAANQTAQAFTATLDTATAPLYFVHVDHLNTPRLVTNDQHQAVWRWDQQEPFGVNVADENPSSLGMFEFPLRYPGQYADKETNLYYNYFRDYDPGRGAYNQSDPIGLDGGLNTYSYVEGNPLEWTDPNGLQSPPSRSSGNPRPQAVPGQGSAFAGLRGSWFRGSFYPRLNQGVSSDVPGQPIQTRPSSRTWYDPMQICLPDGTSVPISGHAMRNWISRPDRDIPLRDIQNALNYGVPSSTRPGTIAYYYYANNTTVVTNIFTGNIISFRRGPP